MCSSFQLQTILLFTEEWNLKKTCLTHKTDEIQVQMETAFFVPFRENGKMYIKIMIHLTKTEKKNKFHATIDRRRWIAIQFTFAINPPRNSFMFTLSDRLITIVAFNYVVNDKEKLLKNHCYLHFCHFIDSISFRKRQELLKLLHAIKWPQTTTIDYFYDYSNIRTFSILDIRYIFCWLLTCNS